MVYCRSTKLSLSPIDQTVNTRFKNFTIVFIVDFIPSYRYNLLINNERRRRTVGNFSREQQEKKKKLRELELMKKSGAYEKQKTRKMLKISVIIALVIAIPLSVWLISVMKMEGDRYLVEGELQINEVDTTKIPDGIYYARYDTARMSATVGVTITEGKMTEIAIYDYENISVEKAEELFKDVIAYQMLNTPDAERDYSEIVLLKTIEAALMARSTTMPSA